MCKQRCFPEVSDESHDCDVKTPIPCQSKLTRRGAGVFGDVFWWEITRPRESSQLMTEDVEKPRKRKWVGNELITQYLCNKLRQEHRRDQMMSGGDQKGKHVEFVGAERTKRGDNTLKCVVQSAVILCKISPLFELASQRGLGVAGVERSMSTGTPRE